MQYTVFRIAVTAQTVNNGRIDVVNVPVLLHCSNAGITVPGSSYHPLEIESEPKEKPEIKRFREAAHASPPRDELIGLVGIDTGLRASAIAHLSPDWLDHSGEYLSIDVPNSSKCTIGVDNNGRGGNTTDRGVPCSHCVDRNTDKEWLPAQHKLPDDGDCWRPKSEAGFKGREIPLKGADTAQIVETYFRIHDKVIGRDGVRDAVHRVAKRAGLFEHSVDAQGDNHYWPNPHDLRNTFGTRLAIKGFDAHEIKSVMGHASLEQAIDYIELSGRATKSAFADKW